MVSSTPYTDSNIRGLLSQIMDPEIPVVSIEEMGMLREIRVNDSGCDVYITPTYTACPAMGIIAHDIKAMLHHHGIEHVEVHLVYEPAWTTDWMNESTRQKLKSYGIAAPVHSSCMHAFEPEKLDVECPRCHSKQTKLISGFGSTPCKSLFTCSTCHEPFDYFKCH